MAGPSALFWETILTHSWPDECAALHTIVPSIMYTVLHEYKPSENPDRSKLEHMSSIEHMLCCMCGMNSAGLPALVGFRVLLNKHAPTTDPESGWVVYRSAFTSCIFCVDCSIDTHVKLKSDHIMINSVLDQFEAVAKTLAKELYMVDMPLSMFFNCIMKRMCTLHAELIGDFGQLESRCMHCKKEHARFTCSGCRMNRYCNAKCSKKDWPLHKAECAWLRRMSIFVEEEEYVKIKPPA